MLISSSDAKGDAPMNTLNAPFSVQDVEILNNYQNSGMVHPFTCGKRDDHVGDDVLIATTNGWVCPHPGCDYTQNWAWSFMADPRTLEERNWLKRLLSGLGTDQDKEKLKNLQETKK